MARAPERKPDPETAVGRAARYFNDGVDPPMIAEAMGVRLGTVHSYLSRARYRGLITKTSTAIPERTSYDLS